MNSESLSHVAPSCIKKLQLNTPADIKEVYYRDFS